MLLLPGSNSCALRGRGRRDLEPEVDTAGSAEPRTWFNTKDGTKRGAYLGYVELLKG